MRDILDDYNEISQIIALAWCDLIEYEFVALEELQTRYRLYKVQPKVVDLRWQCDIYSPRYKRLLARMRKDA